MSKYISEELTNEKLDALTNEYYYLIAGECGSGKTTAIMNNLYEYAKGKNQKILYLCNRSSLEEQLEKEYLDHVSDHITFHMYQSITTFVEKNFSLPSHDMDYHYVVIDEAHLIYEASDYDINPILFLEYLNTTNAIVIGLTGTPNGFLKLEKYLNRKIKVLRKVDKTNNPIRNIYLTEDSQFFNEHKNNQLKKGYKNIELTYLVKNFTAFKDLNKAFNVSSIASKNRNDYRTIMSEYDLNVRTGIMKSQKMICDALITTTAMEVGVNIIANENFLVSFDGIFRPSTIVQFASRVRVGKNDDYKVDIIILVKKPNKKHTNDMNGRIKEIDKVYACFGDYEEVRKKYNLALGVKDYYLGIVDTRSFNPITRSCLIEKVEYNERLYTSKTLLSDVEAILKEEFPTSNIICIEKQKVESYLGELMQGNESLVLFDEEKNIFRKYMKNLGVKSKKEINIPSINLINKFLKKYRIPYAVINQRKRINGEKNQTRYWEIVRHVV